MATAREGKEKLPESETPKKKKALVCCSRASTSSVPSNQENAGLEQDVNDEFRTPFDSFPCYAKVKKLQSEEQIQPDPSDKRSIRFSVASGGKDGKDQQSVGESTGKKYGILDDLSSLEKRKNVGLKLDSIIDEQKVAQTSKPQSEKESIKSKATAILDALVEEGKLPRTSKDNDKESRKSKASAILESLGDQEELPHTLKQNVSLKEERESRKSKTSAIVDSPVDPDKLSLTSKQNTSLKDERESRKSKISAILDSPVDQERLSRTSKQNASLKDERESRKSKTSAILESPVDNDKLSYTSKQNTSLQGERESRKSKTSAILDPLVDQEKVSQTPKGSLKNDRESRKSRTSSTLDNLIDQEKLSQASKKRSSIKSDRESQKSRVSGTLDSIIKQEKLSLASKQNISIKNDKGSRKSLVLDNTENTTDTAPDSFEPPTTVEHSNFLVEDDMCDTLKQASSNTTTKIFPCFGQKVSSDYYILSQKDSTDTIVHGQLDDSNSRISKDSRQNIIQESDKLSQNSIGLENQKVLGSTENTVGLENFGMLKSDEVSQSIPNLDDISLHSRNSYQNDGVSHRSKISLDRVSQKSRESSCDKISLSSKKSCDTGNPNSDPKLFSCIGGNDKRGSQFSYQPKPEKKSISFQESPTITTISKDENNDSVSDRSESLPSRSSIDSDEVSGQSLPTDYTQQSPTSSSTQGTIEEYESWSTRVIRFFINRHTKLLTMLFLYTVLGASVFHNLEGGNVKKGGGNLATSKANVIEQIRKVKACKLSDEWVQHMSIVLENYALEIETILRNGANTVDVWDFWGSFFYSLSIFTTIGYGHFAPATPKGQIATMIYATFGIPLCLLVMDDLGRLISYTLMLMWHIVKKIFSYRVGYRCSRCLHESDCTLKDHWNHYSDEIFDLPPLCALTVGFLYMLLGTLMYTQLEAWGFLEAFYFVFISISTVGFGDVLPKHPSYLLLSALYILFGHALVIMISQVLVDSYHGGLKRLVSFPRGSVTVHRKIA